MEIAVRRLAGESCGDEGCRPGQRDVLNCVTLAAEASTDPQGHSGAGGLVSDVRNWGCAFVPSCQLVVECWLPPDGGGGSPWAR